MSEELIEDEAFYDEYAAILGCNATLAEVQSLFVLGSSHHLTPEEQRTVCVRGRRLLEAHWRFVSGIVEGQRND